MRAVAAEDAIGACESPMQWPHTSGAKHARARSVRVRVCVSGRGLCCRDMGRTSSKEAVLENGPAVPDEPARRFVVAEGPVALQWEGEGERRRGPGIDRRRGQKKSDCAARSSGAPRRHQGMADGHGGTCWMLRFSPAWTPVRMKNGALDALGLVTEGETRRSAAMMFSSCTSSVSQLRGSLAALSASCAILLATANT